MFFLQSISRPASCQPSQSVADLSQSVAGPSPKPSQSVTDPSLSVMGLSKVLWIHPKVLRVCPMCYWSVPKVIYIYKYSFNCFFRYFHFRCFLFFPLVFSVIFSIFWFCFSIFWIGLLKWFSPIPTAPIRIGTKGDEMRWHDMTWDKWNVMPVGCPRAGAPTKWDEMKWNDMR